MRLPKRMSLCRQAARILASRWWDKVESDDVFQEAMVLMLEKRADWWDKHTDSYIVQTIKANLWARLIRRRWYTRSGGVLRKIVEVPLLARGES